jgi:hypothetical protein
MNVFQRQGEWIHTILYTPLICYAKGHHQREGDRCDNASLYESADRTRGKQLKWIETCSKGDSDQNETGDESTFTRLANRETREQIDFGFTKNLKGRVLNSWCRNE